MRETVIQFGEGNFLRAFAEDFLDELNKKGLYDGKAVIVKPTPRGDLEKFEAQSCVYNLVIRGIENGKSVTRRKEIHSISRCVNPYEDFSAYLELAHNPDMRFIISNTTEAGIEYNPDCKPTDAPAPSFPAKLTQLLFERFKAGLKGFILLPCELIDGNGDELKKCVLRHAEEWKLDEAFSEWLESENTFCNTLVDRIVTGYPKDDAVEICKEIGYDDRLLDTAEPYHLWAIEGDFESELPLRAAGFNVIWTDDIRPLKKRKVRLLNGAHTVTVFPAMLLGLETVGECLEDKEVNAFLRYYLNSCVLPVLGESAENKAFADAVLERFSNPFIRHLLKSISLNSVSKFSVRVLPTALDYKNKFGEYPKAAALSLASLIYYYKNREPSDSAKLIEFIKESSVKDILKSDIFGADISDMTDAVLQAYAFAESDRIKEGIQWAIS
ncbi:MAG: tagaturonate reductase [Eubacterium sp.]|nr:tagaturonate reductase [Eubacterium sp.]